MRYKTSVLVLTRDRPQTLFRCLSSLKEQMVLPDQVVIVDNSAIKPIRETLGDFKQNFRITYFHEKTQGEAFARNRGLKLAEEEILVWIDDDCVVEKNWLRNIHLYLEKHPQCDGLLGKTENYLKKNIYATIYQCYYLRWLLENFREINQAQPLISGQTFFDTKNLIVKKEIMRGFSFDPDILFHSINVDNVAGFELLRKGNFFYNPKVIVYHQNWDSFKDLVIKNYYQGIADKMILEKKKIDPRKKIVNYSFFQWLKLCLLEVRDFNFWQKFVFWLLFILYPFPYKIGRLVYKLKR